MAWATPADVIAYTGVTVDAAALTRAEHVVALLAGVSPEAVLKPRDLRYLKQATAYQVAFMAAQVDTFSRTDVRSASQDGASYVLGGEDALVLAPLAKRCLDRLSWRGAGTVRLPAPGTGAPVYDSLAAVQAAWLRDETPGAWRPL